MEFFERKRAGRVFVSACVAMFFLAIVTPASAQITGALVGTVSDPSEAVIPGATVTAINLETGAEQQTETSATGTYQFPLLRAGRYRLVVESAGFQRLQREPVIINTSETTRVDLNLEVGGVAETVTVTEATPLLQSEEATMGHVVEQRAITSLPLATRNFTQILGTSAGVVGSIMNADRPGTGSDSVSVNGARRGSNNLLVDGAPTTNALNMAPDGDGTPSIEFLGEFKVLTSLYSSEYGRNLGSTINVTTRSGSNQFHGAAYEFLRNTKLNARPFFNPVRGKNNQNQFGANIGGPIVRDKTFFFFGWESSRQRNSNSGSATLTTIVPTLDQRQGIFGDVEILDPSTGEPFLNNTIPQSRLNQTALNIQEAFIPKPNYHSGATNYFAAASLPTDINQFTARVDHRFGDNDNIFVRWFDSRQEDFSPFGNGFPGLGNNANRQKHSVTVNETHVFSPSVVLESRFGYDQTDQFTFPEDETDPSSLGLQPLPVTRTDMGIPQFNISDYQTFGNYQNWADYIKRFTGAATMTWVQSRHTVKFGAESRNNLYNPQNVLDSRGRFFFTGDATGDSYADYLLTYTRRKEFGAGAGELKMRDSILGAFVSDEWRVNQALTVTMGMRYEAHWHPAAYNLDMTNWYPDRYTGVGSLDAAGIVQGRHGGVPASTVNGDWNNIMPRVGIAWRVTDKWVIRTGAGLYYDQRTGQIAQQAFRNPPTFKSIQPDCTAVGAPCDLSVQDNFKFLDPGYDPSEIPFPTSPQDTLTFRATDRNTLTDNAWQWNLNVQRQLPANFLFETAYVATKGTHLMARRNFNPLVPVGFDPNNPQPGPLFPRYPGFADSMLVTTQNGNSTYHSFQSTLKRRMSTGTLQLAYTFGKTIGNGDEGSRFFTTIYPTPWWDLSRAKGPANFDRTHRVSLTFTQDLPNAFSRGVGKAVLNDWEVNGFLVAQTGTPLTVVNRDSGNGLGGSADATSTRLYSNVVSGADLKNSGSAKDNLQSFINEAAWSPAPFGTVGSSGRGMFRGPGQWNLDFSLFKDIPITERYRLQFRSEFFNLLNHANFGDPNTNMDSSAFGQISDTSVNARLIQFALKLTF